MKIYFSPISLGFYSEELHGSRWIEETVPPAEDAPEGTPPAIHHIENKACGIPPEAVEISAEQHASLVAELATGKMLSADSNGQPIAVEQTHSPEELVAIARRRRDRALRASDWSQLADALPAKDRKLWAGYRKALRDYPAAVEAAIAGGAAVPSLPVPPAKESANG